MFFILGIAFLVFAIADIHAYDQAINAALASNRWEEFLSRPWRAVPGSGFRLRKIFCNPPSKP